MVLDPSIKALMPDPSTLRDMDKGAARLADAIVRRERIAVFGDYDVDGACSSALMQRFLAAHGLEARIYIPDRMFEGYGPNPAAIETLARDGAKLIVTVDCGTTSIAPLAVAEPLGADVVVVDHHQADERLPDVAAVINPNRQDDLSGLGHLCAAGVTFMVLVATSRHLRLKGHYTAERPAPDLLALLDLVALATVCDVVPLKGLNRAFVTRGLQVMRQRRNIGLKALADAAGLAVAPTPYHLGFVLGPRINAGGRIGDAGLGARLLATDDEMEAARIAVRARQAEPRAQGGRGADAGGGGGAGRSAGGGRSRPAAAAAGLGDLAQGRGGAGRQPAGRAFPAPGLCHRLGRQGRRHRLAALDRWRRYRRRRCGRRWKLAISRRAAAMPWRRA